MDALRSMRLSIITPLRQRAREIALAAQKQAQLVVEILSKGPLDGKTGKWERDKRDRADEEVLQALERWRSASRLQESKNR